MKGSQLVIALLEAGYAVNTASEGRVTARHPDQRVFLVATRGPKGWRVKGFAGPLRASMDVHPASAAELIRILTDVYGADAQERNRGR